RTVTFNATIVENGYTFEAQPAELIVTVRDCPYEVKTTSHFRVQGEDYTARMDWVELNSDQEGHYSGLGAVDWFAHWQVIPAGTDAGVTCDTTLITAASKADITGTLD
ncbi:MAG: hypothetical protein ABI847_14875, partial [Anaerolineales bacterium]